MTALVIWAFGGCNQTDSAAEKEPEFVLTYAENQAEDYPTTQGGYKSGVYAEGFSGRNRR